MRISDKKLDFMLIVKVVAICYVVLVCHPRRVATKAGVKIAGKSLGNK